MKVEKKPAYGIKPRNAEQTFSLDVLMDPDIQLVALTGKAGTGKTLLALAAAIEMHKYFDQILLAAQLLPLVTVIWDFCPAMHQKKSAPTCSRFSTTCR
jgi:PhoH-like ATPase